MRIYFQIPIKKLMNDNCDTCQDRFRCLTSKGIRVMSHRISSVFDTVALVEAKFTLRRPNMINYDFSEIKKSPSSPYALKSWMVSGNILTAEFVRIR